MLHTDLEREQKPRCCGDTEFIIGLLETYGLSLGSVETDQDYSVLELTL